MLTRHLIRAALPAVVAGTFGLQLAHADIYTWVDASGTINISNLAPPDDVRVTKVVHETPPAAAARDDAAREAARRAEVQALADRVRQLEYEVDLAARPPMPPPVEYRPIPAPPVVQYFVDTASPPAYGFDTASVADSGCDPAWAGCAYAWMPGVYPANVIFVGTPNFRRFNPGHGGHRVAVQQPVRMPGGFRRG